MGQFAGKNRRYKSYSHSPSSYRCFWPLGRPLDTPVGSVARPACSCARLQPHFGRTAESPMTTCQEGGEGVMQNSFKLRSCVSEAQTKFRNEHLIYQEIVPLETTQFCCMKYSLLYNFCVMHKIKIIIKGGDHFQYIILLVI